MKITIETTINSLIDKIWNCWTSPDHITNWNFASDDWCCPSAQNDLRSSGRFVYRMEAKDGSMGFDFNGTYDDIIENELIKYTIEDGRQVEINFIAEGDQVRVIESFEAEDIHTLEQQRVGWQAILENFKRYVEALNGSRNKD